MSRLSLAIVLCAFTALAPATEGARQSNPTGAITGRVLDADGRPIAGAVVSVLKPGSVATAPSTATSAEDGSFRIGGLAHGLYIVIALSPDGDAIERDSGGDPFRIYSRVGDDVTLRAPARGVITGTVTDEGGRAVIGIPVTALPTERSVAVQIGINDAVERRTDDRGVYRLFGVPVGNYVVVAGGEGDSTVMIMNGSPYDDRAVTYYPSSPSRSGASEVTVTAGGEARGIDIRFAGRPGVTVSGSVESPEDEISVVLSRAADGEILETLTAEPGSPGRFSFSFVGVVPGEYDVAAIATSDAGVATARRRILVRDADVAGVALTLTPQRLGSVSGRLAIGPPHGCAPDARGHVEEVMVSLVRDDPTSGRRDLDPAVTPFSTRSPASDGRFVVARLTAATYRLDVRLSEASWYVRAIALDGRPGVDVASTGVAVAEGAKVGGVTITVATGAARIGGRVVAHNESSETRGAVMVYIVPAEPESASDVVRYREVQAREDGTFELANVAPGAYRILARSIPRAHNALRLVRSALWDASERERLRREAASSGLSIELAPCQRLEALELVTRP